MHTRLLALAAAAALLPQIASAQQLSLVRLRTERAAELAARLEREGFDVLPGSAGARGVEVVVSPDELTQLRAAGLELELVARGRPFADIQAEQQGQAPEAPPPPGYLDLAQIEQQIAAREVAYPGLCKVYDLTASFGAPVTWNGRTLKAVKVSDNVTADEDEPAVLIVAEYHARELVTPVIALYALDQLTGLYATDPAIRALVDSHEIWIVPVCNPDGYAHVFTVDNYWRKNRRDNGGGIYGVDMNRNHALGWSSTCAGSTNTSSETYRGPAAESEPEVRAIVALTAARRFVKVLDYHSYGRVVLWAYLCHSHPWSTSLFQAGASALSSASGYGAVSAPSSEGEHYEWQISRGAFAFLIETSDQFQPAYTSAQAEAVAVWPGVRWMLQQPVSLRGHVVDACSGAPLAASITFTGVTFQNGETFRSGGPFGRYDLVLPPGSYNVRFDVPGYTPRTFPVSVAAGSAQALEVALLKTSHGLTYCTPTTTTNGCAATLSASGTPSATAGSGFTLSATQVEGQKSGLIFYGVSGRNSAPWGATGFLCVKAPLQRTVPHSSGGSSGACNGALSLDWNQYVTTHPGALGVPFSAGTLVNAQAWFRDPPSPKTTSLSDAIEFSVCP